MQSASENGEALRIVELSKVISRCDADIDRLFDELSHDTAQADDFKKLFDERLARLEIADSDSNDAALFPYACHFSKKRSA